MAYYFKITYGYNIICIAVFAIRAYAQMVKSITYHLFKYQIVDVPKIYSIEKVNFNIKKFYPIWYAIQGYAQTFKQTNLKHNNIYQTTFIKGTNQCNIALDWRESKNMNKNTNIIVCLHGLGGNSNAPYLANFTQQCLDKNFRTVIYNRRGHGKSTIGTKFPKHSNIEDFEIVTKHIRKLYPKAKMFLVGFSCGANLAVNYIAKHKKPYQAAISISNGYNIYKGTKILENNIIAKGIVTSFIQDVLHANKQNIDIHTYQKAAKCTSIIEFEETIVLQDYGYKNIQEYYDNDSCHKCIKQAKTKLLCIGSEDDPFVHPSMLNIPIQAAKVNKNITTIVTKYGGHIGWIEANSNTPWYTNVVLEYITNHLKK